MPIYEYHCAACGFQKEYLQKMSDALLTVCSKCGAASLRKMVTAAGFQLKGSGWYATDFRNGSQAKSQSHGESAAGTEAKPAAKAEDKPGAKSADQPAAKSGDKPAAEASVKKPDAAAASPTSGANASTV